MNNDESFEREVKAALEGMASEPAPERLVASVAGVPGEEPRAQTIARPPRGWGFGAASGFAAVAAVVAVAAAAILLRPAVGPGPGASSSAVVPPSASAPASPSSTASPEAVTSPSPTASAVPIATPTPSAFVSGPVPAGFHPMSATFVSAYQGWVLGSAPCATGRCPVIAHTLDGGRTWTTVPAPPTAISDRTTDVIPTGVAGLRFADAHDGWAFGSELWATHDGGTSWKRLDVLNHAPVVALETARGTAHAVVWDGAGNFRIASTPIADDTFTVSPLEIPVGAGPVPAIQLVLSGDAGWVLENDRVVTAGARLVDGAWQTWQPACLDTVGPAFIGTSSASDLVAACDIGQWSTPEGDHLFVSSDGGATFKETATRNPLLDTASAVATPGRSTIVIAGFDSTGSALVTSYDGGRTWIKVYQAGLASLSDLGFTTTKQGVVITTAEGGASQLLMTRDGGRTWSAAHF
jgi:photosystem II stability/assembly factor-like uncharacterized protein